MTVEGGGEEPPDDEAWLPLGFQIAREVPPQPPELGRPGKGYTGLKDGTFRHILAIGFFLLLTLTVVLSYLKLKTSAWSDTKEWLQILLPAETALLGSATGFYFGSKRGSDD